MARDWWDGQLFPRPSVEHEWSKTEIIETGGEQVTEVIGSVEPDQTAQLPRFEPPNPEPDRPSTGRDRWRYSAVLEQVSQLRRDVRTLYQGYDRMDVMQKQLDRQRTWFDYTLLGMCVTIVCTVLNVAILISMVLLGG